MPPAPAHAADRCRFLTCLACKYRQINSLVVCEVIIKLPTRKTFGGYVFRKTRSFLNELMNGNVYAGFRLYILLITLCYYILHYYAHILNFF